MSKLTSLVKKAINIDLKAYNEGKRNFKFGRMQEVAEQRATICEQCPSMEIEPIEELQVQDTSIPSISKSYCNNCGCTLSYKVRQNISKCPLNKW